VDLLANEQLALGIEGRKGAAAGGWANTLARSAGVLGRVGMRAWCCAGFAHPSRAAAAAAAAAAVCPCLGKVCILDSGKKLAAQGKHAYVSVPAAGSVAACAGVLAAYAAVLGAAGAAVVGDVHACEWPAAAARRR